MANIEHFAWDLARYTESHGLIGLHPGYSGRNCDNHLLFTATCRVLFGTPGLARFLSVIEPCRLANGSFSRYPGDPEPTSWDDLLGLSVASRELAEEILEYASKTDWTWGDKWLGRMPLLVPVVMAGAGVKLSILNQLRAALSLIQNTFEPHGETSGHCMCYLAAQAFADQGFIVRAAVDFWRYRMAQKYPGGMKEVYAIYFGPEHPFTVYGPETFV